MPLPKVEVAVCDVMLRTVASTPLSWVEVPVTAFRNAPAVESVNPPVVRMPDEVRPLTWVEVPALVLRIDPPVMVKPFEEESPPV